MSTEQKPLYAVDLDKTLLDTNMIFDEMVDLCQYQGLAESQVLRDARLNIEASGGSFDIMSYLKNEGASEEELKSLIEGLEENKQRKDFLYPDARPFLQFLDDNELPNLIVTWGSIRNQLAKLRAAGLDQRPYLLTDNSQKGELIKTWGVGDGYYRVAPAIGRTLLGRNGVLVDDKAKSFTGLPEDWTGFLVRREEPILSQKGSIPKSVVIVPDLTTIIELVS